MLTKIALKNFKCFQEEREFPLSHINLLTGINGTGKSTLLQSLLLMYQSLEINPSTTGLFLNGSCLSLGNYEDIKNSNTTRDEAIEIKHQIYLDIFQNSQNNKLLLDLNYAFGEESKDEMVLKIKEIYHKLNYFQGNNLVVFREWILEYNSIGKQNLFMFISKNVIDEIIEDIVEKFKDEIIETFKDEYDCLYKIATFSYIHYISADRIDPKDFYLKKPLQDFPNVGTQGENTINLLSKMADNSVNSQLCLGKDAQNLITQTEEWLSFIFDGAKLEIPKSTRIFSNLFLILPYLETVIKPLTLVLVTRILYR
jgi:predicted ATPase